MSQLATLGAAILLLSGFAGWASVRAEWNWNLPKGFPVPNVPGDNPMSAEKVELGRRLFYDTRLSLNGKFSCASCHQQQRAFADALPRGVGSTGEIHPRGSMTLANVAYSPALTWANPNMKRLEQQAVVPIFGEDPVEMGMMGQEEKLLARVAADPRYAKLFPAAFPNSDSAISLDHVTKAIAAFERTLISGNSAYDRAQNGDSVAMSPAARRGQELFFSENMECFHCHGGFNFTGTTDYVGKGIPEVEFHNTGLYNRDGKGAYSTNNPGLREFTNRAEDEGRFKAPSLRNIALTAPYMHDGSIPTLDLVLDHYAAGGRTIKSGPNKGIGSDNPNRSEFIRGFDLTPQEKRDLVAFLRALTDTAFVTDKRFSNPWADTLKGVRAR
ncbi:MAG: di-heme enzyme [Phycisphaerae bacterium]|nr:di-heme enzyme [Gemmatimonadaceae bacterium]